MMNDESGMMNGGRKARISFIMPLSSPPIIAA
jgi:hypothetical protein